MSTHKAIAAVSKGQVDEIQVPTETPGEDEVLIKVIYASLISFDTYTADRGYFVDSYPVILGFSCAGTVEKRGSGVADLQIGDRVTAFAFGRCRNMQEYAIQPRSVVAKVPDSFPLEEAATLPDNFVTAYYTLFNQLGLPVPSSLPVTSSPPLATTPILIYGAGTTAGTYAIQLLSLAGYRKIIATASKRNHEYLQSLGATHTLDYNSPSLLQDVVAAAGGDGKVLYAVDCISAESTLKIVGKLISPQGKVAILLPIKEGTTVTGGLDEKIYSEVQPDRTPFPQTTELIYVRTFTYQQDEKLRKTLMPEILPALLESGHIKPSRVRLINTGTFRERVNFGLDLFRSNSVSGEKVVVEIPQST